LRSFSLAVGDLWEEEDYWLADEATSSLTEAGLAAGYLQVSASAGVYHIESRPHGHTPS
jgi:hypothetical protein